MLAGLLAGIGPLASNRPLDLTLPLMLAGYLLAEVAGEVLVPAIAGLRHRVQSPRPGTRRRPGDLLPAWARLAYWVILTPLLGCPLLRLVHRPVAVSRSSAGYTCSGGVSWPSTAALAAVGLLGLAGLAVAELALAGLARVPDRPAELESARLSLLMRRMSAHAIAGGAAALGLILTAALGEVISTDIQVSHLCPARPGGNTVAFPWAQSLPGWLQLTPLVTGAALVIWAVSSRSQVVARVVR